MDLQDFLGLQEAYVGVYEARIDDHQNLDPIEKEFVRYKRQTGFEPSSDIDKKTEIRRQVHREKRGAKKREPYRDSSTVSGRFRSSDQNRRNIETLKSRRLSRTSFNNIRNFQREDLDLHDLILSHLLDEGYANTPEAAEVIMVNLSEGAKTEFLMRALGTAATGAKRVVKALNKSKRFQRLKNRAKDFAINTALGALTGIPFG